MVTGSTHASHCATWPINVTVTNNYAQNSMPKIRLTKIPWVNLKFPEFSRIQKFPEFSRFSMFSRVVSTLPFHHKMMPWKFHDDSISNGSGVITLTDRETNTQTDTTENNTTLTVQLVTTARFRLLFSALRYKQQNMNIFRHCQQTESAGADVTSGCRLKYRIQYNTIMHNVC